MKPSDIESHVRCIDLDQAVEVVQIPPGGSGPKGANLYCYGLPDHDGSAIFSPDPRATPAELGMSPMVMPMKDGKPKGPAAPRERREVSLDPAEPVTALKSKAAPLTSEEAGRGGTQVMLLRPRKTVGEMRVHSRATFREVLDEARLQTDELVAADPVWTLSHRIQEQLELMRASTDADAMPSEEQRLSTDVGPIAARTFEGANDRYADLLKELDYAFRRYDALQ